MRVIRPSATTRLTAVSSSPARSIRPAGAPFSHTVAAHHRTPESGHLAAAVGHQHHVGCEHVEQHLEITGPQCRQEPVDHLLVLGTIDLYPRPTRGHVLPGPVSDLPDRGRRLVESCSNL